MRTTVSVLNVAASAARLPGTERIRMTARRGGPMSLPAFRSDPRKQAGVPVTLRRRIDRFSAVAYLAIADVLGALPAQQRPARDRIGLFLANTRAGWSYGEPELRTLVERGVAAMHAYQATAWFPAAAAAAHTATLRRTSGPAGSTETSSGRTSATGTKVAVTCRLRTPYVPPGKTSSACPDPARLPEGERALPRDLAGNEYHIAVQHGTTT